MNNKPLILIFIIFFIGIIPPIVSYMIGPISAMLSFIFILLIMGEFLTGNISHKQ